MRRFFGILLALACALGLTACQSRNPQRTALPSQAIKKPLAEAYPMYFGLYDSKGLELYVDTLEGLPVCRLMGGTNRMKTAEEINALPPVSLAEMRIILAEYDTPPDTIFLSNQSELSEGELREMLDIRIPLAVWEYTPALSSRYPAFPFQVALDYQSVTELPAPMVP